MTSIFGSWIERLECVAASKELVAVGGRRDAAGVADTNVHVFPPSLLETGKAWSLPSPCAVYALAFAGESLLLVGGDDGALVAWDVTGQKKVATLGVGGPVRAIAIDGDVARGDRGALAVGTSDGKVVVVGFALDGGNVKLSIGATHALSDGAIHAVAWDPAGLWLAGGADGQLAVIHGGDVRRVAPGGEGGIRAIVSVGDGRALVGCGDGSVRACYVVGAVEATDRSGDYGHEGAIRGLALGPIVLDDAGREQARRFYTVGEDRALKLWLLDGARRPRTLETVVASPATALAFAPGVVPKVDKSAGRLWITGTQRTVSMIVVMHDGDLPDAKPAELESAIASYKDLLADVQTATSRSAAGVQVKLDTITALAAIAEDAAREVLDFALTSGQPTEVLLAAAGAMARSKRRASRPVLRKALAHAVPEVRAAAFAALYTLETEEQQPIAAIREAMGASNDDVRIAAITAATPLAEKSVVARGVITDALKDRAHAVRRKAFAALRSVVDVRTAVKTALAHGIPDIRGEALLYLGFVERTADAAARALAIGAFDDADPGVRSSAFLAAVAQRRKLAARLAKASSAIAAAIQQVTAQLSIGLALPPDDGATLEDDELEPLFVALACRNADAANRGAGGLVAVSDPRAIGAVLQLTREADPALRRGATANVVAALARWPGDDRLITRLQWLLDDVDNTVRAYAFDALVAVMVDIDLAELALRTSHEDIRVRALQILVKLGSSERTDALLGDALDDESPKVRTEAYRTEWAWHASEPMAVLARGRASRHADLRTMVVSEIDRRRMGKQSTPEMDKLAFELLTDPVASVGLTAFAALARPADPQKPTPADPAIVSAAMMSPAAAVRAVAAQNAHKAPASAVRARLVELVKDENAAVHIAAIEALDAVAPTDGEGFALAFASVYWNLQVRACELLGKRRDKRAVAPTTRILTYPKTDVNRPPDEIRRRAADALAQVGDLDSVRFLAGLVDGDDDSIVKEMAARGIATAAVRGHEVALRALVALLGHENLAVRSWGGEGLAKLGDLRALPVLAGTQRHDHRPLRIGAIVGFVALGPDGVRGLRQGLEDREREIADLAFAVIVARDVALASANIAPDLLVDAMSSPSPEIRFAAARLYEHRVAGSLKAEDILGELVGPTPPTGKDAAKQTVDWPAPDRRAALLQVVADAIASDDSQQRYAATQVVALRTQPVAFWREAARLAGPSGRAAPAPHTGWNAEARVAKKAGWLRRLVGERRDPEASELENLAKIFRRVGATIDVDHAGAQRLVFGVYAGLVRQAPKKGEADETHRVRRDAVARLADLAREDAVGADAVLPVLGHAVGDPHHLVRQAAMTALRSLYPVGALAPLSLAVGGAADLGKAAIDELVELAVAGDDRATAIVKSALDADDDEVRAHAAMRLPRLYPAGSVEPQLLAAQSKHGDVRLAAVGELAGAKSPTPAVTDALITALASEHDDLRMAAATGLAKQGNPLGVEVLGTFLKSDDHQWEAKDALENVAGNPAVAKAAAEAIAKALDEDKDDELDRDDMYGTLGTIGHAAGAPVIVKALVQVEAGKEGEVENWLDSAIDALKDILKEKGAKPRQLPSGDERQKFDDALALSVLGELVKSPVVEVRKKAAAMLGDVDDRASEDLLAKLIGDRVAEVRVAAAEALALRAEYAPGATLAALEAALRGGRRELVLPAAMGLAGRKRPEAFQPLLLVAKAGEPEEQQKAIIAVGGLGDKRALEHIVPLLTPEPGDELGKQLMPFAVEALGRLLPALSGDEANDMREKVEQYAAGGADDVREHALTGLRYGAGERGRALLERIASEPDEDDDIRAHCVRQLGLLADPASEPVLAELLGSDEYEVQEAAQEALMKVVGRDPMRYSLHALVVEDSDTSEKAAKYLAREGDPALLVDRLGAVKNDDVRRMLREGLIRRKQAPVAALERALASEAAAPRAAAAWVAGAAGGALGAGAIAKAVEQGAAGLAAAMLTDETGEERDAYRAALWAARRANQAKAAAGAAAKTLSAMPRVSSEVRVEAARVLADAGERAALAAMIEDGDRDVREIAARAQVGASDLAARVEGLGSRADAMTVLPAAVSVWPQVGKKLIADAGSRTWALAVSVVGGTRSELIAIAKDKKAKADQARLDAIGALGLVGGDDVVAALEAIHGDDGEDDEVKKAAWRALRRIGRSKPKTYAPGQDKGKGGAGGGGSSDDEGGDDDDDAEESSASDDGDGDGDGDEDGGDEDGADDSEDDDAGADDSDDDDGDDDDDDGDDDEDEEDDE